MMSFRNSRRALRYIDLIMVCYLYYFNLENDNERIKDLLSKQTKKATDSLDEKLQFLELDLKQSFDSFKKDSKRQIDLLKENTDD